ncbi:MAG: glutamate--tRNA ligase family protein, partial [Clostridia bacterium]
MLKSDGLPTYNFANVVDDHLMHISHVIRGIEYLSSTPKYNLIYDAFGWARPTYMHLPPIMKDATRKLSKRFGDANFEDFIAKGYLPQAVVNYIALLGWCPKDNREKMTLQEMIEAFDTEGISHSSAIFDEVKMRWLNGEYLKAMTEDEFFETASPWIKKAEFKGNYNAREISKLLQTRVDILSEIKEKMAFLDNFKEYDLNMYIHQKMKVDFNVAKRAVKVAIECLIDLNEWTEDSIRETIKQSAESANMKSGQVMFSMRVALTGEPSTP